MFPPKNIIGTVRYPGRYLRYLIDRWWRFKTLEPDQDSDPYQKSNQCENLDLDSQHWLEPGKRYLPTNAIDGEG